MYEDDIRLKIKNYLLDFFGKLGCGSEDLTIAVTNYHLFCAKIRSGIRFLLYIQGLGFLVYVFFVPKTSDIKEDLLTASFMKKMSFLKSR